MGPLIKVAERVGWGKCDCQKMLPNDLNGPIYIVTKIMPNIGKTGGPIGGRKRFPMTPNGPIDHIRIIADDLGWAHIRV